MSLDEGTLSGVDVLPADYEAPQGFYVLLHAHDLATSERLFRELAERGSVRMPLQKTFWSPSFGVLVDRFGVPVGDQLQELVDCATHADLGGDLTTLGLLS